MKRIFLTSGLVLCMACPAFATTDIPSNSAGTGLCVNDTLGTATNGDNVQFKAKWTGDYTAVTFNENDGTTLLTGGASSDQRPDDIFLVGGVGLYKRTGSSDADYEFTKLAVGDAVLTAPDGITVNYTLNKNAASVGHNDSEVTMTAPQPATRQFQGYYASTITTDDYTGASPMITSSGALTTEGNTAAATYNNSQPWKAIYNTVSPTVSDPSLPGYTFQGWSTSSAGTNPVQTANLGQIGANTELWAVWQAAGIQINFNCNTAGSNPAPTGTYAFVPGTGATANDDNLGGYMTINMDASGTLASSCTLQGWTFQGWDCTDSALTSDSAGQTALNGTISTSTTVYMKSSSTVTCNAVWDQNEINLHWDANNATTYTANGGPACDYDGNIQLPTNPQRTGYTFNGWEVVTYTEPGVDSTTVPQP